MALCDWSDNTIYTAVSWARECWEKFVPFCGLDNVILSADNTEVLKQKTQDGCTIRYLQKTTSNISFDMYNFSAEHLNLIFDGEYGKTSALPVVGAIQTLSEGQWSSSATKDTYFYIENRNADNTMVNVTSVEGTVDTGTTLVDGTDYKIELEERCNPDGSTYNVTRFTILAWAPNISTNAQDINITYDYTWEEKPYFNLRVGSSTVKLVELMIIATNRNDPTDRRVFMATWKFNFSGNIFEFNESDETLTEATAANISFEVETNTKVEILGIDELAKCCSASCQ